MALYDNMAFKATQGEAPLKYLGVVTDGSENHGSLLYTTDEVLNLKAKFAIEFHHNNLYNIRSCLNNKYWVRHKKDLRIVAEADEPVNDQKSVGCTLFKMEITNKNAKFHHVESGAVVRVGSNNTIGKNFLTLNTYFSTQAVSFVVDYDSIVVLPRFVAFKGSNNLYYKNFSDGSGLDSYAQFSVHEISDPNIVCECTNTNDGHLRIRAANHTASNMYWNCDGQKTGKENLITWSPDNPIEPAKLMFDAVKISDEVFALRSRFNNKFCMRSYYEDSRCKNNRLVAKGNGPVADAHLQVIEPVFNRTVDVYEFNLDRARIYGVMLLYSHEHIWDNYSDEAHSGSANGTITTTTSNTFNNTITASMTVKTTFKTKIPFLFEGKIETSVTGSYTRQWGGTTTDAQQIGHVFNVKLVPQKTTIARGVATKGKCDVPFSYVQKDYPTDGGPPRVTKLYDGWFTGANAYSFRTEVRHEHLPYHNATSEKALTQCIKRPLKSIAA